MTYYMLLADGEKCVSVCPKDDTIWRFFTEEFAGTERFSHTWKPFEVEPITEFVSDPTALGDIVDFCATEICLFSERARTVLGSTLELYGELLPVFCRDRVLYLYHVTTVLDGLDESRSIVERFTGGKIMHVKKYVLNDAVIRDIDIFRIVDNKWRMFVSDRFVEQVRQNNLEGFLLAEI